MTSELELEEIYLKYARGRSQHLIEEALRGADLLDIPETDADSKTSALEIQAPDHVSVVSFRSNSTTVSIEELLRRSVLREIEQKMQTLREMHLAYDDRRVFIANEHAEYQKAVLDGICDLPQRGFNRWVVKTMQNRTGAFIDAEITFNQVNYRARALGVLGNAYEQESHFVDDADNSYYESFEANLDRSQRQSINHAQNLRIQPAAAVNVMRFGYDSVPFLISDSEDDAQTKAVRTVARKSIRPR